MARSVVERFVGQVETGRIGGQVIVKRLIEAGLPAPEAAVGAGMALAQEMGSQQDGDGPISLRSGEAQAAAHPPRASTCWRSLRRAWRCCS